MTKNNKLIQIIEKIKLQLDELLNYNTNSLLFVSNDVKNYDQLVNCCKDTVKVVVYDKTKSFDYLTEVISTFSDTSFDNIGWIFDSLNQKSFSLGCDYTIDLSNKYNVKQFQKLIDFVNSIRKYVKSDNQRFDLISCDLDEDNYNHMIQILELSTDFDYAYSSKVIGNTDGINWLLDMLNNTSLLTPINLVDYYFDNDKLNKLENGTIRLDTILSKYYFLDDNIINPYSSWWMDGITEFNHKFTSINDKKINIEYSNGTKFVSYTLNSNKHYSFIDELITTYLNIYGFKYLKNIDKPNNSDNVYTYRIKFDNIPMPGLTDIQYIDKCYTNIINNIISIGTNDPSKYLNYLYKTKYASIFYQTENNNKSNNFTVTNYFNNLFESRYLYNSRQFYSNFNPNYLKSIIVFINNNPNLMLKSYPSNNNNICITYYMNITNILTYGILIPNNISKISSTVTTIDNFNTSLWSLFWQWDITVPSTNKCPIISILSPLYDTTPYVFFSRILYSLMMLKI